MQRPFCIFISCIVIICRIISSYPPVRFYTLPMTLKMGGAAKLCSIVALASFSSLGFAAEKPKGQQNQGLLPLEELRTFTRVYDHVRSGYVEEVTDSKLLEYAIKGMIAELDPHSAYLDKEAYAELQATTSGEFGGVGLEVGMDDGAIKVITPLDGSPSQKAGIKAGDIIVRLDDQPMKGKTLTDTSRIMRGPKDSPLKISVTRKGIDDPLDFVVLRDLIHVQSVSVKPLSDNYLYVRIAQFQTNTGRDFTDRLREALKQNPKAKGLILDLRNNPGGVLQASVEVADAFLDGGLVVYTQGRMDNSNVNYNATAGDLSSGLPLVALINAGSASASEIVAGALQDHRRAVIMGTRSFGKGSVQTVIPITEERAIKLTTALYFTPNGRSIQAKGIEPDVRLQKANTLVEQKALRSEAPLSEADLAGHLSNRDGEIGNRERGQDAEISDDILKDNQVLDALNLLKGMQIFGQHSVEETATKKPAVPAIAPNIEVRPQPDELPK